jgi:N-acetylglucosamine-6-phosphate deacetylase
MPTTVLVASAAYTPDLVEGPVSVVCNGTGIEAVAQGVLGGDSVVDLRPWRLAPGYVDLHIHGFAGYDVNTCTADELQAMAAALPATGVTSFLPTIASASPARTWQQVVRSVAAMQRAGPRAAEVLGVRLEGPFINRTKKGAQDESAIRAADATELARLAQLGPIRLIDFAPELDADFRLLRTAIEHGIVACIGHTAASYDEAQAAISAGVRHCTHLFNAMPQLEHRAPGAPGALLTDPRVSVEIIADGVHVHPGVLRLVAAARGAASVALVTDAMAAAGSADGAYEFLGHHVTVRDGAVRLPDGNLAGSVLTMDQAVRNMVTLVGCAWADAIRMATLTPASIVGAACKGKLAPGADADMVVLDEAGRVRQTWREAQVAFVG